MSRANPGDISQYIFPGHIIAFRWAAKKSGCALLLRRTNPQSLPYIGRANYLPKPISCKTKTADRSGRYQVAGLVVNPTIHGPEVFDSGNKHSDSLRFWKKMVHAGLCDGPYKTDLDKSSKHYGCLMLRRQGGYSYIHGDYDLYDVVDMQSPQLNSAFLSRLDGSDHNYGPKFKQVKALLNEKFSAVCGRRTDMIQHGSEAKFARLDKSETDERMIFGDEPIDIFWPPQKDKLGRFDISRVSTANGKYELTTLYYEAFEERKFGFKGVVPLN